MRHCFCYLIFLIGDNNFLFCLVRLVFRMRVIQMTTDGDGRAGDKKIEKPRDPDRTRDLFGVQLEVQFKIFII